MDLWQILVLALLQGLTEFLPISSSAHLILVPILFGWEDQGLAFDIAVHVGTLSAVILYFRTDLTRMIHDWGGTFSGQNQTPNSRLAWGVLFGTIPIGLAGLFFSKLVETDLRSPHVIAWSTLGFALLLWWSDTRKKSPRNEKNITWKDILVIGFAQALSLIPGTSRSGITITAARGMGLNREGAARLSFLFSIPVIFLAGAMETIRLIQENATVDWRALFLGTIASGISAYLCIDFFLKLVGRIGLFPFVIYRLVLGVVLLALFS